MVAPAPREKLWTELQLEELMRRLNAALNMALAQGRRSSLVARGVPRLVGDDLALHKLLSQFGVRWTRESRAAITEPGAQRAFHGAEAIALGAGIWEVLGTVPTSERLKGIRPAINKRVEG